MNQRSAAEAAYRLLIDERITQLPVEPLCLLRRQENTAVWTYREAAERLQMPLPDFERQFGTADAFTLHQGNCRIVVYRSGGNPARQRFTLAHELGHLALGHLGMPGDERAADAFASHLLCPQPLLLQQPVWQEEQLAMAFFVSRACAREVLRRPRLRVDEHIASQLLALFEMPLCAMRMPENENVLRTAP